MNVYVISCEGVNEFDDGIVIVGGGLVVVCIVEQLCCVGYLGCFMIVSDEVYLLYDCLLLFKEVLCSEVDDVVFKFCEFYDEKDIVFWLGLVVVSLDMGEQMVMLVDGMVFGYDEFVIVIGLVFWCILLFFDFDGIWVFWLFDESMVLCKYVFVVWYVVVVGVGFIGCEVVVSLCGFGVDVVLVELQLVLLVLVLGEQIGQLVMWFYCDEGVDVCMGVIVVEVCGKGYVDVVVLIDGIELLVDLVVVGIGLILVIEWLEGSGVEVDNGVICDKVGWISVLNVWVFGDVVFW